MLRVVGLGHVLAQLDGSRRRTLATADELHERGLARAVWPHERNVVAAVQLEVDALIDEVLSIGLCDAFERDHKIARTWRVWELEAQPLGGFGKRHEFLLDLLDATDALLDLPGLRRLVAELVHEDLHVADITLLGGPLGTKLLEVVLPLSEVVGVVAHVGHEALVLK